VTRPLTILYAEDEQDDILFLQHGFKLASLPHILKAVPDGAQVLQYLAGESIFADRTQHPFPDLILLDINMPKQSGLKVLEWIRGQSRYQSLPILILTSSSRAEDMETARRLGVQDYLLKPSNPLELVEVARSIQERWLSQSAIASGVATGSAAGNQP